MSGSELPHISTKITQRAQVFRGAGARLPLLRGADIVSTAGNIALDPPSSIVYRVTR